MRSKSLAAVCTVFSLIASGCASKPIPQTTLTVVETMRSDVAITVFASGPRYSVNAYLVETPEGLVLIDSLRTRQDVEAVIENIRSRDAPLVGILLTHTHPDHIGGLNAVVEAFPDTPIFASGLTASDIRDDRTGMIASGRRFVRGFGPDVPAPTHEVTHGQSFTIADLVIEPVILGPGEAESMTLYFIPELSVLAAGDLAGTGMTPWLVEGRSGEWLAQLQSIEARLADARVLLPGHGAPGPARQILVEQAGYLTTLRALVAERMAEGRVPGTDRRKIAASLSARYPTSDQVAPMPDLMDANIKAIALELAAGEP